MSSFEGFDVDTSWPRRGVRPPYLLLFALAALFLSGAAAGRTPFLSLLGEPHAAFSTTTLYVTDRGRTREYEYELDTKFSIVAADVVFNPFFGQAFVIYALSNKTIGMVPANEFDESKRVEIGSKAVPAPIAVSNDADAFDVACDGRTAIVAGANSATPVSLVDLSAGREIATAPFANRLARAVAVDDAGTMALAVLDNPVNNIVNEIRRLVIGAGVTDSGEQLGFATDFVSKVRIVPGGKVGIALVGVGVGASRIVSFSLPGLAIRSSATLAGGTGNALVVSADGTRVYVRSGRRAIVPDVIEGFTLDPSTGAIGQAPVLRITNVPGFTGVPFLDSMALAPESDALLVVEETPTPRITYHSVANGAVIGTETPSKPLRGVSVPRPCSSSSTVTAVEFHHGGFDHYFVSTNPAEIGLLDNGTHQGWTRTGNSFQVYALGSAGKAATCRFFSTAFGERSSHFYTPVASECSIVKNNPVWQFEGEVFSLTLPAADGSCAPPERPLYRLYNQGQGGAPNHRYTTSVDVRGQMIVLGWVPEGNGVGVIGCVPGSAAAAR